MEKTAQLAQTRVQKWAWPRINLPLPKLVSFDFLLATKLVNLNPQVYLPENPVLSKNFCEAAPCTEEVHLTSDCIYKELRLRGYDYGPTFQGILGASSSGTKGELLWNGNWVSFLDTMLQVCSLA